MEIVSLTLLLLFVMALLLSLNTAVLTGLVLLAVSDGHDD